MSILPMRKLRLSEVKCLVQGQGTGKWRTLRVCVPDTEDPILCPFSAGEKLARERASLARQVLLWENFADRQLPLLPCAFLLIYLGF